MKKKLCGFVLSVMLFLSAGCSTDNSWDGMENFIPDEWSGNNSQGGTDGDTSGDDLEDFTIVIDDSDDANYTEVEEVVPTDKSDAEYDDFIENSTFSTTVKITYNGTSANVEGAPEGVSIHRDGAHVIVTSTVKSVEYVLGGNATDGSFKIYSDNKFRLTLNGVSITNSAGAAINVQSKKRVFVVNAAGSSNTLTDDSSYTTVSGEDEKACLFSEGQLIFSGTGELTVNGNYKHGICSDDYVYIRAGSRITVASAVKDGIHTNDKIVVGGGILNITANGDGMECEEGYIALRAGKVTVHAADDGIVTSYEGTDTAVTPYIGMYGGLVKIVTTGDKGMGMKSAGSITVSGGIVQAQVSGAASKGLSCDGDMQVVGGKIVAVTSGGTLYEDNDLSSAAGIKCDGELTVSNATVALKSTGAAGKGINCDGNIHIKSGVVKVITTGRQSVYGQLDSSAKGIKSDKDLTIDGGLVMVRTGGGEGSEGIESKNILTINDGEIEVSAYDDCINASKHIAINGGRIYCYSAGNDAIDSNGTLTITGGTVVASGTQSPEEGIDCDRNTFIITGGTVIGIGGAAGTPTGTQCKQPAFIYSGSGSAGTYLSLSDSNGKAVLAYKIPRSYNQMTLLVSSPDLKQNGSYVLNSGGTVSGGTDFHGLLSGTTYSGGSQLADFTLSSMVTTLGSSSHGGGGNRPGW